jgi:hypothetical protein
MATYRDNWDLRAGFTKDYDLATSAVKEADKQFASAQEIVKDAYALDRTAATQEGEISRMNQENLEKLLVSQERVGDFQSQQEIQRALESLGTGYANQPVSTEADLPPEQPRPEVVTEDGRLIPDPTAPINAVPNAQKPPSTRPAARPMTQIERLQAIEPMLASPRAKAALRNMVVKESVNEARMLATIAPDEAFNGLIKNGVIRGNPLIANDDNITYSRIMPDGKNKITIDRNEAAAWVGDMINKTSNQYKLLEERRQTSEKLVADKELDTAKTDNRIQLERTKAGLEAGLVNLRASKEGGGGSGGAEPAAVSAVTGAPVAAPEQVRRTVESLTPAQANEKLKAAREGERKARISGDVELESQYRQIAQQLQAKTATGGDMVRVSTQMFDEAMKDVASTGRPMMKIEFNREIQQLKKETNDAIRRGDPVDAKAIKRKIDAIVKRSKEQ